MNSRGPKLTRNEQFRDCGAAASARPVTGSIQDISIELASDAAWQHLRAPGREALPGNGANQPKKPICPTKEGRSLPDLVT